MPGSNLLFQTQGSWETSNVFHQGQQIACMAILLNISSKSYLDDRPGGLEDGAFIDQAVVHVPKNDQAMDEIESLISQGELEQAKDFCNTMNIFPGEITIVTGSTSVKVFFDDPLGDTSAIRVFLEDVEVTNDFCNLNCEIDYIQNVVRCSLTLTKERRFLSHDNETIPIL